MIAEHEVKNDKQVNLWACSGLGKEFSWNILKMKKIFPPTGSCSLALYEDCCQEKF